MGSVSSNARPPSFDSVTDLLLANTKSSNQNCADCDIVTSCHACPGGMLDAEGAIDAPISLMCENMMGTIEGRLAGLGRINQQRGAAGH